MHLGILNEGNICWQQWCTVKSCLSFAQVERFPEIFHEGLIILEWIFGTVYMSYQAAAIQWTGMGFSQQFVVTMAIMLVRMNWIIVTIRIPVSTYHSVQTDSAAVLRGLKEMDLSAQVSATADDKETCFIIRFEQFSIIGPYQLSLI